jgi:hypothetical protein
MFDFIGLIPDCDLFVYLFGAMTILGVFYLIKYVIFGGFR